MSKEHHKQTESKFTNDCAVCGRPLTYGTEPVGMTCAFCGKTGSTLIYCPEGHYICDSCHQSKALDVLRQVLNSYHPTSPIEILERVMAHPSVPMHGPEHHAIVPAAIVAAVHNAGYPVPEGAIEEALARGAKVPGGWCGFYGACGAALGAGIAVSVLTKATPLTGEQRSLANEATSFVLSKMLDGHPRCCKRASRKAIEAGIEFLKNRMGITLEQGQPVECLYSERNKECPLEACPYYIP